MWHSIILNSARISHPILPGNKQGKKQTNKQNNKNKLNIKEIMNLEK